MGIKARKGLKEQIMRPTNSLFSCFGVVWALSALSLYLCLASPLPADEKPPVFQEIEGLKIPAIKFPEGKGVAIPGAFEFQKPLVIDKRKDLKTILGKGKDMLALRKSVDFEKQKVLLFRWNGSGKDTLAVRLAGKPDDDKSKLIFDYTSGLTRDLRFHAKLFVIRNDAQWEVVRTKPGAGKVVVQVAPIELQAKGAAIVLQQLVKPRANPLPRPVPLIKGGAGVIVRPGQVNAAKSMRIYKQWTGFLPNGAPSINLPEKGYVNDEETWNELWHAWRPMEKLPEVNFQNEIVLVGALPNALRVYVRALKTADGKVTFTVNGSGSTKGLSYSFAKVMRTGLITINGERLPGAPD